MKFLEKLADFLPTLVEWIVKGMVYFLLFDLIAMGIRIIYGAFFSSNAPGLDSAIVLSCIGGLLIFLAVLGLKYRKKIWS